MDSALLGASVSSSSPGNNCGPGTFSVPFFSYSDLSQPHICHRLAPGTPGMSWYGRIPISSSLKSHPRRGFVVYFPFFPEVPLGPGRIDFSEDLLSSLCPLPFARSAARWDLASGFLWAIISITGARNNRRWLYAQETGFL